jgi:hypothetical protein
MEDDGEYTQLTIPEAFVFRIPPRTSAQGHKCVHAPAQSGHGLRRESARHPMLLFDLHPAQGV